MPGVRAALDLLISLTMRDVRVRYQLSILGLYWGILNPLLMALIYGFVFSDVFHSKGISGVPYLLFIFSGMTFWGLFSNSLTSSVNSLTGNASMLSKVPFPRIILPTSSVLARFIDFVFSLCVLLVMIVVYHRHITIVALWDVLLVVTQLLFTLGLGYVVSSLNVFFRDVSQILNLVLMIWLYLSPVFYVPSQVPVSLRWVTRYNVIGNIVHMEVAALINNTLPSIEDVLFCLAVSVVVFVVGWLVFISVQDKFAEVM